MRPYSEPVAAYDVRAWIQRRYPRLLRGETPLAANLVILLAVSYLQYHDVLLTLGLSFGSLLAFTVMLHFRAEGRHRTAITLGALVVISLLLLGVPKVQQIITRSGGSLAPQSAVGLIALPADGLTDSVVQQEEAGRTLLRGHDPYGHDYTTVLGSNGGPYPGFNPATHHLAYLPGTVLLSAAGLLLIGDRYDARLWLLPALILLVIGTYLVARSRDEGIAYVALTVLNPLYLISWLWSSNDILFIAPLALSLAVLRRGGPVAASLLFVLSMLFKSLTAVLIPIYVALAIRRWGVRRVAPAFAMALVAGAAVVLPFFLWSPKAFVQDTLLFVSAGGPDNYPITGYSLGSLLLRLGLLHDPWQPFPAWIFQIAAVCPVLLIGLPRLWERPDRTRIFALVGACFMLLILSSRFAQHNYFVFPAGVLLLAAWTWITQHERRQPYLWAEDFPVPHEAAS